MRLIDAMEKIELGIETKGGYISRFTFDDGSQIGRKR